VTTTPVLPPTAATPAPAPAPAPPADTGFEEANPVRRRRRRLPLAARVALALVLLMVAIAVFAPLLAPHDPIAGNTADRLQGLGSPGHPLGTDGQGRDILSRLMWGARPSLLSGMLPVLAAGLVGTTLGVTAGLGGRKLHGGVMRTLDVFYAFPAVILAIGIAATLGSGISNAIIALSVVLIPPIARVAETETSRVREAEFMDAARASGASMPSIAVRHVMPTIAPPVVVYCTALIGLSIVFAAGLGFLGLGISPPDPEWGLMVNDLRQYLFRAPSLALVPATVILVVSVLFNVLGDGLRDRLDVRSEVAA
jgi:peptide/nickel transport system permease protein